MHRHCADVVVLAFLATMPVGTLADTPPPRTPFDAITWDATLKAEPSLGVRMGSFYVRLEKTTLDDVRRVASVGDIAHQGDAGESVYWLCYTNVGPTPPERIWIMAHGEMGGDEHFVTNISAEVVPSAKATTDCPTLPAKLTPVSLDQDIWLRSLVGDVLTKLGQPSYEKEAWRSFNYRGKVPGDCENEGLDLLSSLLVRVKSGQVTSLYLNRVTSC
jgi:hypothetical protein